VKLTGHSEYVKRCPCGHVMRTEQASGTCKCGREFEILWGEQDPKRLKSMAAVIAGRKESNV